MILAADIKQATSILEVIARYVQLRQAGREWTGLCPFHSDSSPSLSVNDDKQVFLCRSCGVGGDVISFVQRIEGITFAAAVRKLASEIGLSDAVAPHVRPTPQFELAGAELRAFDHWLFLKRRRLLARLDAIDDQESAALHFSEICQNDQVTLDQGAVIQKTLTFVHVARSAIEELIRRVENSPAEFVQPFLRDLYGKQELRELLS